MWSAGVASNKRRRPGAAPAAGTSANSGTARSVGAGKWVPDLWPIHDYGRTYINDNHGTYASCPVDGALLDVGIDGWQRRDDALTLYELAYFAQGDILEAGFYHGLATSIMSRANHNSALQKKIVALEVWCEHVETARKNLAVAGVAAQVEFRCEDTAEHLDRAADEGRSFALVFVDHSHRYADVLSVCNRLARVTLSGGFVAVHDFNDQRNADPEEADYAVCQAATEALAEPEFAFHGVFGCTAVFRRS